MFTVYTVLEVCEYLGYLAEITNGNQRVGIDDIKVF